jgi:hypothetical protein
MRASPLLLQPADVAVRLLAVDSDSREFWEDRLVRLMMLGGEPTLEKLLRWLGLKRSMEEYRAGT